MVALVVIVAAFIALLPRSVPVPGRLMAPELEEPNPDDYETSVWVDVDTGICFEWKPYFHRVGDSWMPVWGQGDVIPCEAVVEAEDPDGPSLFGPTDSPELAPDPEPDPQLSKKWDCKKSKRHSDDVRVNRCNRPGAAQILIIRQSAIDKYR